MKNFKVDNKGTGQIFSNNFLERLSRTHFLVPVIIYYGVSFICLLILGLNESFALIQNAWIFPIGILSFTLFEYLVHRFVFHFHAISEQELDLQYKIHGIHHEFPRDKFRLVMPPVLSVVIATVFYVLFTWIFAEKGILLFAGFVFGYSTYLFIHYAIHAYKPPRNFLRYLWKHHSLHHYSSEHSAFSVSLPIWDFIFRTMPSGKSKAENS